jgi:biotin carboxylase
MKKLLIIGAGTEQVPAIKIAREMGYYVLASDMNPNAPGMSLADEGHVVSTKDVEGNLALSERNGVDGVMTLCSETAVPVVAEVTHRLGLPGFSPATALAATHKGTMRRAMEEHSVPVSSYIITSAFREVADFCELHPGPWVIKPSDSSGQRGTTFTSDSSILHDAFEDAITYSGDGKCLVDRYVEGPEINVTALVINREVKILSLSNRITLGEPNFGIAVRHIAPTHLNRNEEMVVGQIARDSIRAIGLENGIAYPQIIMGPEGPVLVEIAARIPGGHMRDVGMHLSGIDMIKTSIWQALGEPLTFETAVTEASYPSVSIKFITSNNFPPNVTRIEKIEGIEEASRLPAVQACYLNLKEGMAVPRLENSVGRFGAIIVTGSDKGETVRQTEYIFNSIRVNGMKLQEYTNYNIGNRELIWK